MKLHASLVLALAMSAAAHAQGAKQGPKPADPDGVVWVGNWDEALKEAKARNVPIHFALHKDN
jgi:hypothetical protein